MTQLVLDLADAARAGRSLVGTKAATLARLAAAGFPVPPGFVVTSAAAENWESACDSVAAAFDGLQDGGSYAVRSSGTAEDLDEASFAGQYASFLKVPPDEVPAAVRRVFESVSAEHVAAYTAHAGTGPAEGMAVLVQEMVDAESAGVAFSANPITGARDEIVITAVRGLGERLVSGAATGDTWTVRAGQATCQSPVENAIDAEQAAAVADLVRRVTDHLGAPQDIEWAIDRSGVRLLQARPMTALPGPVRWPPPGRGLWIRNFRLGEWLPEPMTPLFRSWLLERIEEGFYDTMKELAGAEAPRFPHAAVNGWYYSGSMPRVTPFSLLRTLLTGRTRFLRFAANALVRVGTRPEKADRAMLGELINEWRSNRLPEYRRLVCEGSRTAGTAGRDDLMRLIDSVGHAAGEQLLWLAVLGGSAWKMEGCLARFYRRHLAATVGGDVQTLLQGLSEIPSELPPHAVQSVDWYHPTAGELGWTLTGSDAGERRQSLRAQRRSAEEACVAALSVEPGLLERFRSLLAVTQRYCVVREEQAAEFTFGWPLLRRCVLRLGSMARDDGMIDHDEGVFFLLRHELEKGLLGEGAQQGVLRERTRRRRARWESERRLSAPLLLGRPPLPVRLFGDPISKAVAAVRRSAADPGDGITGQPASPGRATGRVRVLREPADFGRFERGEVLVARATTPAWTPLFALAAAVVTDGGTLAAHASLVAREYGIPAVVGTGDSTERLRDGQMVTVDGSSGSVHVGVGPSG